MLDEVANKNHFSSSSCWNVDSEKNIIHVVAQASTGIAWDSMVNMWDVIRIHGKKRKDIDIFGQSMQPTSTQVRKYWCWVLTVASLITAKHEWVSE